MSKIFKKYKLDSKMKDMLLILTLGILLIIAITQVFQPQNEGVQTITSANEKEQKLSVLLQEMNGVGDADVIICETEEGVQSVVVVCEGANDLQVVMDVREAVSAALGAKQSSIKVYLKKE